MFQKLLTIDFYIRSYSQDLDEITYLDADTVCLNDPLKEIRSLNY